MKKVLSALLHSKKFLATLLAFIVATTATIAEALGVKLPEDSLAAILAPILTYVVGQGIADAGQSAQAKK